MFNRFLSAFKLTTKPAKSGMDVPVPERVDREAYRWLMGRFGGATFEHGLYRLHAVSEIPQWDATIGQAFPAYASRISCFGWDWLGRQFALDSARVEANQRLILMLEPGTGEVLEIPATFVAFHDVELVDEPDAALARDFFVAWRKTYGSPELQPDQCVGYKIPLFLGGSDTVDNLEIIDAEVYWAISGQLRDGTRLLPPGTTIRSLTIS